MIGEAATRPNAAVEQIAGYPLLDALIERRSRRFGKGFRLSGGPLAYESTHTPQPLSRTEEAALAFAACGITGCTMGEMPYQTGAMPEAGTGNVLINYVGRTVGSADSVHAVSVVMINDEGTWLLKRPQDLPRSDLAALVLAAREHRFVELYENTRVRLADRRLDVPREARIMMPFNKWAANVAGTTYFVPVNELSALYINIMLMLFSDDLAAFVIDDRNRLQPAGISKFGRSKGGMLCDDPKADRITTVSYVETVLSELIAAEQGQILQNLALMTEALGLGGFTHYAAHPYAWLQALDFRTEAIPFARTIGVGPVFRTLLKILKKSPIMPTPVGLERDGETLLRPFCPPYYRNMEEAVLAFLDYKFAQRPGRLHTDGVATMWQDPDAVEAGIPRYSDQTIAATIAYCEYVYQRYGRFPASSGPFRTVLAYQAHHLDLGFYDRFYHHDALPALQRQANV